MISYILLEQVSPFRWLSNRPAESTRGIYFGSKSFGMLDPLINIRGIRSTYGSYFSLGKLVTFTGRWMVKYLELRSRFFQLTECPLKSWRSQVWAKWVYIVGILAICREIDESLGKKSWVSWSKGSGRHYEWI